MIKKMLIGLIAGFSMLASTAFAEVTLVVPQKAGQGTTVWAEIITCLLYTSPSPRDTRESRMPSSA